MEAAKSITEARERAAKAEEAAAKAYLARVQLERQMAAPDIPGDKFHAMADRLSRFAGQRILISLFPVAYRTWRFASDIESLLVKAGWTVEEIWQKQLVPQLSPLSSSPFLNADFWVSSTPDPKSVAAAEVLLIELTELPI
ncbi:MAG: hypothetical protein JO249_18795, partial [Acidobacteria bacterium]|nr:hypothetical protein [Acidobacteriota bacterium]